MQAWILYEGDVDRAIQDLAEQPIGLVCSVVLLRGISCVFLSLHAVAAACVRMELSIIVVYPSSSAQTQADDALAPAASDAAPAEVHRGIVLMAEDENPRTRAKIHATFTPASPLRP